MGSFSDCESRTSNPDPAFLVPPGYEDHHVYNLKHTLDALRKERDDWIAKYGELETNYTKARNDLAQSKARLVALENENEILGQAKESLTKTNQGLVDQIAELQETVKELKKTNRKSSSSPPTSSATASESSDEKKLRRSSSKRHKESRAEKDKEREKEKERERIDREREREARRKEKEREKEREREREKEETERLRKRFDTTRGEESDAKSSNTSSRTQRNRRDSYIEPLGQSAPRPQVPVPPSPSRQYSTYTATAGAGYPPATAYSSIREPFGTTPRSHHPSVLVVDDYNSYGIEDVVEDPYRSISRSIRHPR